jgi:hypothetical protein
MPQPPADVDRGGFSGRGMLHSSLMAAKEKKPKEPRAPLTAWLPAVALGWLIPGGGHFLLKRRGRGALLLFAVLSMFLFGIMMRGVLFEPRGGDPLTIIIYCGGFLGDLSAGLLYMMAIWLGYAQPEVAGQVHDYGTKFLVTAGLLNILAMVDVYEIAVGKKS